MSMISIVVPVLNEKESLKAFYDELTEVAPSLDEKYEIVFIDDGSTDNSLEIIKSFSEKDNHVRAFSFRRNLGKAEALTFGFMQATGDYIVTLDADLQDRPSEIHKLLTKAKEGTDLVSGFRQNQKRPFYMIGISKIFNGFLRKAFDLDIHDYNCGLKVYTKDAAKSLRLYGGLHRFIPILASQQGFTVDEVPVAHDPRKFGKSKYGFSKIFKDLPDMFSVLFLANFSKRPLHFFGMIGGITLGLGVVIFGYLTVLWFMGESIGRRPLFFSSILLILAGMQTIFTGFLADLIISIAHTKQSAHEFQIHFPLKYSSDKIHN